MKIGLKTMLLDVHMDLLYQRITFMIAYFAAVAMYNLARKDFRAAKKFRADYYVI